MKVARTAPYYYLKRENLDSGLKPYYFNLVRKLKNLRVTNDMYVLDSDGNVKDNVFIVKRRKRFSYLLFGYDIYKKIKSTGRHYDIIHTHQPSSFLLYFFKNKFKAKFVHTIHGSPVAYKKIPKKSLFSLIVLKDVLYFYLFNKYICKRADKIITVSSEARREVIESLGIKPEKVIFIPTAVDLTLFKKKNIKKDIDILYVGRFVTKKNLTSLVSITSELKKEFPKIKLYLVGGDKTDDDYNNIIKLINVLKLKNNVFIYPPIKQKETIKFYNRSKLFALMSYEEGLPKVLLEALACGLPVVASNNSGMKDVVVNGKNGFLIDINNKREIVKLISEILNKKYRLGMDPKLIQKKFSWETVAKKVKSVYGEVMRN